jgi:hypothetical protein
MTVKKAGRAPAATAQEAKPRHERTPREVAAIEKIRKLRAAGLPRWKVLKPENKVCMDPAYPDELAGHALLLDAMATASAEFMAVIVEQLVAAGGGEPDERLLNFMFTVIKGIESRDQLETMLAAQMAAVHVAAMRSANRLEMAKGIEERDSAERAFNKLTRTFMSQMEALKRYRAGAEGKVTVQQVNVGEGGQAIVGNVTQACEGEGHAVGGAHPQQALTYDREQQVVPLIGNERHLATPAARRGRKK